MQLVTSPIHFAEILFPLPCPAGPKPKRGGHPRPPLPAKFAQVWPLILTGWYGSPILSSSSWLNLHSSPLMISSSRSVDRMPTMGAVTQGEWRDQAMATSAMGTPFFFATASTRLMISSSDGKVPRPSFGSPFFPRSVAPLSWAGRQRTVDGGIQPVLADPPGPPLVREPAGSRRVTGEGWVAVTGQGWGTWHEYGERGRGGTGSGGQGTGGEGGTGAGWTHDR